MAQHEPFRDTINNYSCLWEFMKQLIGRAEIDTIQEIIGDEVILNNWVLWNEVQSLREILQGITQSSLVLTEFYEPHEVTPSCHVKEVPSLQEWNRDIIVTQIVDLLQVLGEDGTEVLKTLPIDLANYFHNAKERKEIVKIGVGTESSCKSDSPSHARNYFDEIYGMRQKFNVFDLPDVLPAVLDAFSAEEITLKMHAERLRKLIDAKSGNKDDGEEGLAGGDKPSLETALKLQSRLEKIKEEKDLINRNKKKRNIPPLNIIREDAYSELTSLCTKSREKLPHTSKTSGRNALHSIDSAYNQHFDSQWQQQANTKSKKRSSIIRALEEANKLQVSNIFSDVSRQD